MTSSRPRRTNSALSNVKEEILPSLNASSSDAISEANPAHAANSGSRKRRTRDATSSRQARSSAQDKSRSTSTADRKKLTSHQHKRARAVSYNESGEELFCVCNQPYDERRSMIGCDICDGWFHPRCVNITITEASKLQHFVCPTCRKSSAYLEMLESNGNELTQFTSTGQANILQNVSTDADAREDEYGELAIEVNGESYDPFVAHVGSAAKEIPALDKLNQYQPGSTMLDIETNDIQMDSTYEDDASYRTYEKGGRSERRVKDGSAKERNRDREKSSRKRKSPTSAQSSKDRSKSNKNRLEETAKTGKDRIKTSKDNARSRDRERDRQKEKDPPAELPQAPRKPVLSKSLREQADNKRDRDTRERFEKKPDKGESTIVDYVLETDDDDFVLSSTQGNVDPKWFKHDQIESSSDDELVYMSSDDSDYSNWMADNEMDCVLRSILDHDNNNTELNKATEPNQNDARSSNDLNGISVTSKDTTSLSLMGRTFVLTAEQIDTIFADLTLPHDLDESGWSADMRDHNLLRHMEARKMQVECGLLDLELKRRIYLAGLDQCVRVSIIRTMAKHTPVSEESSLLEAVPFRTEEHGDLIEEISSGISAYPSTPSLSRQSSANYFTSIFTPSAMFRPLLSSRRRSIVSSSIPAVGRIYPPTISWLATEIVVCTGCDGLIPIDIFASHIAKCAFQAPECDQPEWASAVAQHVMGSWVQRNPDNAPTSNNAIKVSLNSIPIGTSNTNIQSLLPIPPVIHTPMISSVNDVPKPLPAHKKYSKELSLLASDGTLSKTESNERIKAIKHDYNHQGLTSISGRFGVQHDYLDVVCGCPLALCAPLGTSLSCSSAFANNPSDGTSANVKADLEVDPLGSQNYRNLESCSSFSRSFLSCTIPKDKCINHLLWEEVKKIEIEQEYYILNRRLELLKSHLHEVYLRLRRREELQQIYDRERCNHLLEVAHFVGSSADQPIAYIPLDPSTHYSSIQIPTDSLVLQEMPNLETTSLAIPPNSTNRLATPLHVESHPQLPQMQIIPASFAYQICNK